MNKLKDYLSRNFGVFQFIHRLEIPRARFKEENKVVNDGLSLSINSIHSHDEDNAQGLGYNIKSC